MAAIHYEPDSKTDFANPATAKLSLFASGTMTEWLILRQAFTTLWRVIYSQKQSLNLQGKAVAWLSDVEYSK